MDAQIDDFFNEINEIAPPKKPEPKKNVESVWKECHDELTGYSYYWNCKTDEVTWDVPEELKDQKKTKPAAKNAKKPTGIYVPPKTSALFSSAAQKLPQDTLKIYSIGESSVKKETPKPQPKKAPKRQFKRDFKKGSDSEDEKIVLISSYGGDSSENEEDKEPIEKKSKVANTEPPKEPNDSYLSEEDDDIDILTKIQKRAKELKELGGELPEGVKEVVENPKIEAVVPAKDKKKDISGFSLVAGYSDSEEENEEIRTIFLPKSEPPPKSHSTLFPITEPIDVKDFIQQPKAEPEKQVANGDEFHSKAFQRKRRIGVALVNTAKKKEVDVVDEERKGLGFEKDANPSVNSDNVYQGFKKGGIMFVKTDVLNPTIPKEEETAKVDKVEEVVNKEEVGQMYSTLKEKLLFLNGEGPAISPVQTMVIQAETLFTAMNDGGLKLSYLQKWLTDTCAELIKLEKEATPEGWLLQWDRSHKRYYYQHLATGVSQWEYPQQDSNTFAEAMDISTTPPPAEQVIRMSPPLPPTIRSPTPPPPPIISAEERTVLASISGIPPPPQPELPPKASEVGEPLPPGVDLTEVATTEKSQPQEEEAESLDPLNSALNSFYSEVAAIDPQTSSPLPPPSPPSEQTPSENPATDSTSDVTKKKKKTKVKLAPGLSMKKKGVSQLVEKWKSVQQHYND